MRRFHIPAVIAILLGSAGIAGCLLMLPRTVPAPFPDIEPANMQGMLLTHNQVRAAHGLPPLRWSGQMASYAQQWSNYLANYHGCEMEHRSHLHADLLEAGENIYWASPLSWSDGRADEVQQITPSKVAQDWASEKPDYNYAANTCPPNKKCGHYTQMVWRTSTEVGCGMTICPDKGQIWVCNYNPAGNYEGERPY